MYAPNTNPTYEVESNTQTVLRYDFEDGVETRDSSANAYNLLGEGVNVSYTDGRDGKALTLAGGESYVETRFRMRASIPRWTSGSSAMPIATTANRSCSSPRSARSRRYRKRPASLDSRANSAITRLTTHCPRVNGYTSRWSWNSQRPPCMSTGKRFRPWSVRRRREQVGVFDRPLNRIGSNGSIQGQIDDVAFYTYASAADQLNALRSTCWMQRQASPSMAIAAFCRQTANCLSKTCPPGQPWTH